MLWGSSILGVFVRRGQRNVRTTHNCDVARHRNIANPRGGQVLGLGLVVAGWVEGELGRKSTIRPVLSSGIARRRCRDPAASARPLSQ